MGTVTIVIEIPGMSEAAAAALKAAIKNLPTFPGNATIQVAYAASIA